MHDRRPGDQMGGPSGAAGRSGGGAPSGTDGRTGAGGRRQRLGQAGETLAAEHLARRGYEILERNFRTRWGELDIVAFDGRTLVFCEVKSRRMPAAGRVAGAAIGNAAPLESVHPRKRQQIRRIAGSWLRERPDHPYARLIRFDAIGVILDEADRLLSLEHLESAF